MNPIRVDILCDGGLGNRLNSLIGGLLTADAVGGTPVIHWPVNNWCECELNDLYSVPFQHDNLGLNALFSSNLSSTFIIHENQTKLSIKVLPHQIESIITAKDLGQNIVYFHNLIPSYFNQDAIIRKLGVLVINPDLVNKAKRFIAEKNITEKTLGFMFRKTDYSSNPNMKLPEDDLFSYMNKKADVSFYVCSDDKSTEDRFASLPNVSAYPKTAYVEKFQEGKWDDLIIDSEGRLNAFNVRRIKDSVIEAFIGLLILSQTKISVRIPSTFLDYARYYKELFKESK